MNEDYLVRDMLLEDSDSVIRLLQESFKDPKMLFLPMRPTRKSAYHFYKIEIEPAIINGDPCFVVEHDKQVIAFNCFSTCINKIYDLDSKIALGVITVVKDIHRRKGISENLRLRVMKEAKNLGVEYVMCDIFEKNIPSILGMKKICKETGLEPELIFKRYGCRL